MIARKTEVDIYTWSHNCDWGWIRLPWEQSCLHQESRMHLPQSVRDQRTLPLINNKLYFTWLKDTWQDFSSEPCCTGPSAQQDNWARNRGRCPRRVISSRHTGIGFYISWLWLWVAPHIVEVSPAGVACHPREAGVKVDQRRTIMISSPADDHPPPRQEGEAVERPWLRKIRDGAGGGGWEQLDIGEVAAIVAADHDLPWCRYLLLAFWLLQTNQWRRIFCLFIAN